MQEKEEGDVQAASWALSSPERRAREKVRITYVNVFVHVTEQLVTTRFSKNSLLSSCPALTHQILEQRSCLHPGKLAFSPAGQDPITVFSSNKGGWRTGTKY